MTRPLLALSLASAVLSSSGCAGGIFPSHLHDAERAALTAKLVATLDAYDQSSPTAYEALVKSSRAIATEQDKVLIELANNRAAAFNEQRPFRTYAALGTEKETIAARLTRVDEQVRVGVNQYLKEQKIAAGNAATAAQAIRDASDAVEAAKRDVTSWNASIAVLQAGVATLPAVATAKGSDSTERGLEDLRQRLSAVGDKEVEFVDANGVIQKGKLKDILSDRIKTITKDKDIKLPDAPGATLTILTLGVDLAKTQKERADARLVQIARRFALYERILAESALATVLLGEVDFSNSPQATSLQQDAVRLAYEGRVARSDIDSALRSKKDEQRDQRVQTALVESDKKMLALSNVLLNLRKLAVADSMSLRAELALERDAARLDHDESLLEAQVNDREWKAVLRAGVSVLNQYEQGGFTREDVANIIRIAQAIALGVIAGKVD